MSDESTVECIQDRKNLFDNHFDAAMTVLLALSLDALAVVIKIRLTADKRVHQLLFVGQELGDLIGDRLSGWACGAVVFDGVSAGGRILVAIFVVLLAFAHGFFGSSEFSEKNCAMNATAVITRS